MSQTKTPPKKIPEELISRYSMQGKAKIEYLYFDNSYPSDKPLVYAKEEICSYIEKVRKREFFCYEQTDLWLYEALEKYDIRGKSVAIMGSDMPRYESICIFYGGKPTTIDYNKIISEDPRLKTMTVEDYKKNPVRFDIAISVSSFEHDGLGRYGDPIDPDGDLKAMEHMRSVLKPGGIMFLAVPVGFVDKVVWNAHRIYSRLRLKKLLGGWKVLCVYGTNKAYDEGNLQPVFVLQNRRALPLVNALTVNAFHYSKMYYYYMKRFRQFIFNMRSRKSGQP